MRGLMPALLLAGAMTLVACGDDSATSGGRPQVVDGPAQADIDNKPPYGSGIVVGDTYDYLLFTHCGVEWTRIDGAWWRATPLGDAAGNPPSGWGNPYDAGQLHVVDDTSAVYSGGPGVDVEFKRTDRVEMPVNCA